MAGPMDKLDKWLRISEDTDGMAAVQSHDESALHHGEMFQGSWVFSGTAAGASEDALLICDDDKDCHMSIVVTAGGGAGF